MEHEYVLLAEKEEMWAKTLMEVLRDHDVPCIALSVYGAGFTIKTGMPERLRVCVPAEKLSQARELMEAFFSPDAVVLEMPDDQQDVQREEF